MIDEATTACPPPTPAVPERDELIHAMVEAFFPDQLPFPKATVSHGSMGAALAVVERRVLEPLRAELARFRVESDRARDEYRTDVARLEGELAEEKAAKAAAMERNEALAIRADHYNETMAALSREREAITTLRAELATMLGERDEARNALEAEESEHMNCGAAIEQLRRDVAHERAVSAELVAENAREREAREAADLRAAQWETAWTTAEDKAIGERETRTQDEQRIISLSANLDRERKAREAAILPPPETSPPTYPCADCGAPRTRAEGGTTFKVCEACWDKHYAKEAGPAAGAGEATRRRPP